MEGIIPALESAHAIAFALKLAAKCGVQHDDEHVSSAIERWEKHLQRRVFPAARRDISDDVLIRELALDPDGIRLCIPNVRAVRITALPPHG